jgi:hypothetical protein
MASLEETRTKISDTNTGLALELGWLRSILHDQSVADSDPRALVGIAEPFSTTTHKVNLFRLSIKVKMQSWSTI